MNELIGALDKLQDKFKTSTTEAAKFSKATEEIGKQTANVGKGAAKATNGMKQFAASLVRIAKYRILRTMLRELSQSFREGLQNAYQFSKGIGGELAASLDLLSTKSLTMKNQLGSAFGELLMNIMPILQKLIALVTTAANAISQFFAALGGRGTYLKAVDASKEFAENTAAGAGAAKELRRQLMGFDEINRLDNPNSGGGGGGGGSALDASKMFEESPIPQWVQDLGERLNKLKGVLLTIAGIIGGISLLRHIGELLNWGAGFDSVMKKITGIAVAIAGAVLLLDGFIDALNNGVDWGNLLEMLGGAALLVIGLGVAFGSTAAAIGLLISGIMLCIVGIKDWITTGKAATPVLTAISVGVLAIGAAIALMTGSWIPAVIAAVGAAVVWIVGKWDEIKAGWATMWNNILNSCINAVNAILSWLSPVLSFIDRIVSFFGGHSNFGTYQIANIPAPAPYATGGFPEDGMFMANHGELVGQFTNGKTAVANNQQIIEGIKQGVYDAMVASGGRSSEVKVYLDGKQITNAVTRNQRSVERTTGVALA